MANDESELTLTVPKMRRLWVLAGLAVLVIPAALYWRDALSDYLLVAVLGSCALLIVIAPYAATARVAADRSGVHTRTLFRRRYIAWAEVAEIQVTLDDYGRGPAVHRVTLLLSDGKKRKLPVPYDHGNPDFEAQVEDLRRFRAPDGAGDDAQIVQMPRHPLLHGSVIGLLIVTITAFAFFGIVAFVSVPQSDDRQEAWAAAEPCTRATPADKLRECLHTLPATVTETDVDDSTGWRQTDSSSITVAGDEWSTEAPVSADAAEEFRSGDQVQVTFWRGDVVKVAGERLVWDEEFPTPTEFLLLAGLCALAAVLCLLRAVARISSITAARRRARASGQAR